MNASEFYKQFFDISQPHKFQLDVFEKFLSREFPLLIKAPSGSGKTEAVIAPFLSQFIANDFSIAPRMIYVLPMRVLANTLAERIQNYANRISRDITVKIQHGDHPLSPYFISDIVVTTLDQFLYGFARASQQVGHHIDVPLGSIASSIVVFDEAHMYRDEFTFSIMRALMEILNASNIPFVIMTATMPETLEESLFENINGCQRIFTDIPINSQVDITVENKPLYSESEEINIPENIFEKIRNKKTLIVVNQVKRAQKVYKELKNRFENQIVLLHSRFTRLDREKHEKQALTMLPHKQQGQVILPESTGIVVSTQVLEAGIDFSAELLITEEAPADALVQRAGRCARYPGEKGEMIIFPVKGDKAHLPYDKDCLSRTMKYLKQNNYFNIKDFHQVCDFVNKSLDYRANDFEAADTLIDLFECVLYADQKPENIQIRKHKSAKVIIVEARNGGGKRKVKETQLENGIKEILEIGKLGDFSFDVDINVLWGWFKSGLFQYELVWEKKENSEKFVPVVRNLVDKKGKNPEKGEDPRIRPFSTYIIEKSYYDETTGVEKDASEFI
ncbi:MAG: CRISPR-associated helicase Cas3' [bacterium]|nr:CRISPR-associated helicase Cas3' [bacterium]